MFDDFPNSKKIADVSVRENFFLNHQARTIPKKMVLFGLRNDGAPATPPVRL